MKGTALEKFGRMAFEGICARDKLENDEIDVVDGIVKTAAAATTLADAQAAAPDEDWEAEMETD